MKIKRFNENSENKPEDVIVRVSFDGDYLIPLNDIKEAEYFNNYSETTEGEPIQQDEYESAIYYGAEEYMHTQGVCNYSVSYQTGSGEPILDLEEYEELLKNKNKYNL